MRILITGATGFLGQHMLPMLGAHEVFAISRSSQNKNQYPANINWIEMNLSEAFDISKLPEQMDAVIHLAQSDQYRNFPDGAADMFKVNVAAPAVLLNWAQKAGVSRFVAASSGTVYEPFTGPMTEDAKTSPPGYYGASKLAAETLALAYEGVFNVSQLRVFFLYGPGQQGMMIANVIKAVKQGETLTLPHDCDGLEFVPTFVEDVARVFVQACEEGWSGVYNVAAPHKVSFKQLIEHIGKAVGRDPKIERIKTENPVAIVPNLDKISTRIDVDSFLTLQQGLENIVALERI